jgi:membrane protease YdiL (CAAX protease family)
VRYRTTTTPAEAFGIVTLCFGWFIVGSAYAVSVGFQGGSFSEAGVVGLVGLEVVLAIAALYVLASRGFDVASLYPRPSLIGVLAGLLVSAIAFGAAWAATSAFDWSYYSQPLERLMGGSPIGLQALVLLGIVNGTYEEIFLLGFLLRGLRGYGLSVAIGVSVLVRVLYHLYQGPLGALYVGVFGLVLSLYYVSSGKLFPVVLAHALWDIIPFVWNAP